MNFYGREDKKMTRFETEVKSLLCEFRRTQEENYRKFFAELHAICDECLNDFSQDISVQRQNNSEEWMTADELAKFFKVSKGTIYHWRDEGIIPQGIPFGPRQTRWKVSEVENHLRKKNQPLEQNHSVNFIAIPPAKKSARGRKSRIKKLETLKYA